MRAPLTSTITPVPLASFRFEVRCLCGATWSGRRVTTTAAKAAIDDITRRHTCQEAPNE